MNSTVAVLVFPSKLCMQLVAELSEKLVWQLKLWEVGIVVRLLLAEVEVESNLRQ